MAENVTYVWTASNGWLRPLVDASDIRMLDEWELRRAEAMQDAVQRERYILAHVAVRWILLAHGAGGLSGLKIVRTRCPACGRAHGKPRILGSEVRYSLTRCADDLAVVLADGREVGVDIEPLSRGPMAFRAREAFLSSGEMSEVETARLAVRNVLTLQAWTRKEAVLKATGEGITANMRDLEVLGTATAQPLWIERFGPTRWCLTDLSFHEMVGAVCVQADLGRLERIDMSQRIAAAVRRSARLVARQQGFGQTR